MIHSWDARQLFFMCVWRGGGIWEIKSQAKKQTDTVQHPRILNMTQQLVSMCKHLKSALVHRCKENIYIYALKGRKVTREQNSLKYSGINNQTWHFMIPVFSRWAVSSIKTANRVSLCSKWSSSQKIMQIKRRKTSDRTYWCECGAENNKRIINRDCQWNNAR